MRLKLHIRPFLQLLRSIYTKCFINEYNTSHTAFPYFYSALPFEIKLKFLNPLFPTILICFICFKVALLYSPMKNLSSVFTYYFDMFYMFVHSNTLFPKNKLFVLIFTTELSIAIYRNNQKLLRPSTLKTRTDGLILFALSLRHKVTTHFVS